MPVHTRRQFLTTTALASLGTAAMPTLLAQTSAPAMSAATTPAVRPLVVGMVLFEGFQLLDVFGPLEMFSMLRDNVSLVMLAERTGPVRSAAGPQVIAERLLAEAGSLDVVMIPGGAGTRREVGNRQLVATLKDLAEATPHVATICTGSALFARTGLLDGRQATTNKRAYAWATGQGPSVIWVPQARWVEDGKYFTSSGISAGMDMTLGLIEKLFDRATAERAALATEYTWHSDKADDPFAKLNGLVK